MAENPKPREGGSKKLQFNTADGFSKLKSPAGLLERSIADGFMNSELIEDGADHGPGLKKKGFQITSVTAGTLRPAPDHAEDSLDDLDETSHTEDVSCSDLLDNSLKTDDQEVSSAASSPSESDRVSPGMVASNGAQSRFKVVKIESREPFHRGRWMCRDFLDPSPEQPPVLAAKDSQVDTSSASSSNITSVYQKSDGKSVDLGQADHKMAVNALRQDNKSSQNSEKATMPPDSSVNVLNEPAGSSMPLQQLDLSSIAKVPLNDGTSSTVSENDDGTSTGMLTANTSQAVLEHVENILATDADGSVDSSASNSTVAIDNKIEQAMDLVKSHLMVAVREEVDILKEKIVELTDRISQLEYENTILKNNATQETLAQLQQPRPAAPSTNASS